MINNLDFSTLQNPLVEAKNILIILGANPKVDSAAAGLALYLSLKKQGKNVSIACPTAITVAFNRLIGVDKISSRAGSRNLVISFAKDSIEKISSNTEDDKLNLIIEPKANFPPLDFNKISYSYTGVNAKMIIVIGADRLEDLQNIYQQEKKIFTDKLTVNISNSPANTQFGKINLLNQQASSCSEITAELIKKLNMPIDEDVATNLYSGLKSGSVNFEAPNVSTNTFELAAFLLKNGAKKDQLTVKSFSSAVKPAGISSLPADQLKPAVEAKTNFFPSSSTPPQPPFVKENENEEKRKPQPPPDWFKPKIYKGDKAV